ncbi:MAG TPA: S9 family peptidase [Rudaea sp.]|nr:S9 family peptidase [Rudaea sp.]
MKALFAALALAFSLHAVAAPHAFNVHDLVMMNRVSDPQLSPDGKHVAYQMRQTDYDANKGVSGIWLLDLDSGNVEARRLTDKSVSASSPRWSADGRSIYYLANGDDATQVWNASIDTHATPVQITHVPLDVNAFELSPNDKHLLVSIDVFADCPEPADVLACSKKRLDDRKADKATGTLYHKLFIRHWDTWSDGRRSQLFIADLDGAKSIDKLHWLTRGIDGDVPSKPFGDDSEFSFSPDGKTVYFDVRIAGTTESWSTNFDIYSVPTDASAAPKNLTAANKAWDASPLPSHDGKTLYYLAMKRPGFEADRFGIMAMDLGSGEIREIDPKWDRSAGPLQLSADGKTLYTTTDDNGDHALFAVNGKNGEATRLVGDGSVTGFAVGAKTMIVARQDFKHPTDLYTLRRGKLNQITHVNADRLKDIAFGDYEWFDFPGWNNERVQGYVMKPVGYEPGKKYPVAFYIHGGPQGAWTNDFHYRWNPETYAGQGFAVVAINFHGSTGYGQAFTDAISQHWGDRPLEDLQKGWDAALKKYGFLDSGNACALGASYGGYMVYWIAGVWNQPWKCLIDHDGVFDNRMMAYATEEQWFSEWENGGTQWQHPENYERFNPINHVADWRVPMLVIHSDRDYRIPLSQGIAAFTALQRRGIPSEFLRFPDESHWVQKPHNSVQWHDAVNAWLKKWTDKK